MGRIGFQRPAACAPVSALLDQLGGNPGESIPLACQDWANTEAAYRFFDNNRVSEMEILDGHFQSTRERVAATDGPILVLHDTTEFSFKRDNITAVGITRKSVAGAYRDGAIRYYGLRHPDAFELGGDT